MDTFNIPRWIPGTDYIHVLARSADLPAVQLALHAHGIGIDHWRPLYNQTHRSPRAPDCDVAMFCFWLAARRPLGAPEITDVALEALSSFSAMAGSVRILPQASLVRV
jgi:hypothetical protein